MINIWLTESPVVRVSVCLEKSQQPCSAAKSRVQGRHALVCWWSDDNNGELAPVLTRECGHWSPLCSPGWDVQRTSTHLQFIWISHFSLLEIRIHTDTIDVREIDINIAMPNRVALCLRINLDFRNSSTIQSNSDKINLINWKASAMETHTKGHHLFGMKLLKFLPPQFCTF